MSDTQLLLIGAGIALFSSMITVLVTGLVQYWLNLRTKNEEQKRRVSYIIGQIAARTYQKLGEDELDFTWAEGMEEFKKIVEGQDADPYMVAGLIGMYESILERLKDVDALVEKLNAEWMFQQEKSKDPS